MYRWATRSHLVGALREGGGWWCSDFFFPAGREGVEIRRLDFSWWVGGCLVLLAVGSGWLFRAGLWFGEYGSESQIKGHVIPLHALLEALQRRGLNGEEGAGYEGLIFNVHRTEQNREVAPLEDSLEPRSEGRQ